MSFPPPSGGGEGPGCPAQPASLPPTPRSCLARQTDTHRAPWGWQRMAGTRSCFACHAVAASSTEIPSSSSPLLSAKSSPCFLALAPRDQTRGDRTKRKTKGNKNKTTKKKRKKKNTTKKKREFKNSMIAETVGPRLCPTALLATHTAPLPEPGQCRARAGLPQELCQDAASPAASQILPGEGWGAREDANGAVAASALAVDESLKALADPPASQPGPRLVTHPQLQARLPLLALRCEQEPCSQLCCPWEQLSSAELTPRVALRGH